MRTERYISDYLGVEEAQLNLEFILGKFVQAIKQNKNYCPPDFVPSYVYETSPKGWLKQARELEKGKSGIYIFWDENMKPLYIGKTGDFDKRFQKFESTNFLPLTPDVAYLTVLRTFQRDLMEQLAIEHFKPKYNGLGLTNGSNPNNNPVLKQRMETGIYVNSYRKPAPTQLRLQDF